MSEIVRPATAFSLDAGGRQKRPRIKGDAHLRFIRSLPCLICGRPAEAAHIRYGSFEYGKRHTGKGEKPSDFYTIPLCREHHAEQHRQEEEGWWLAVHEIDPIKVALALWSVSGDEDAARAIIAHARGDHRRSADIVPAQTGR